MAFSFGVEMLNIRASKRRAAAAPVAPVRLRPAQLADLISDSKPT
jgi:hypothetical protein